jgi:hypothetical protein
MFPAHCPLMTRMQPLRFVRRFVGEFPDECAQLAVGARQLVIELQQRAVMREELIVDEIALAEEQADNGRSHAQAGSFINRSSSSRPAPEGAKRRSALSTAP